MIQFHLYQNTKKNEINKKDKDIIIIKVIIFHPLLLFDIQFNNIKEK